MGGLSQWLPIRKPRVNLPDAITARWYARQRPVHFPFSFKGKKKFIFFPWQGAFLWIILTILIAFCLNYNNNLGIAGVGVLGVFYFSSLFQNYWSMSKIVLQKIKVEVAEQDNQAHLICVFLHTRSSELDPPLCWAEMGSSISRVEFDDHKQAHVEFVVSVGDFGVFDLPRFRLSTRWPHAITQTWIDLKLPNKLVVVPKAQIGVTDDVSPSPNEQSVSVATGIGGDIEGIRGVLNQESASKIAWKSTLRHGRLMTYTWENPHAQTVLIRWPEGSASERMKLQDVRNQMERAIQSQLSFQLIHPQYSSKVGKGIHFGRDTLAQLMPKILPSTPLPQSTRWGV